MQDDLDRDRLQRDIHALYEREHAALGEAGTLAHLERAEAWDFAPTLAAGGVLVFPHVSVLDCGYQVAAAVRACLDSGADRVVVISVLHAFTHEMEMARRRVAAGGDPGAEAFHGIQGSGIEGREEWRRDHALMSWRHFWCAEVARRGLPASRTPEVFERYPWLAGGKPGALPGIDELAKLARNAAVVSTADPFHHGLGYGTPPAEAFEPDAVGLARARKVIEAGIALLERGDYPGYERHCVEAKSDARDAGPVFRFLRGAMSGRIVDMTYTDATGLYASSPPTWVAAPLVEWRRAPA